MKKAVSKSDQKLTCLTSNFYFLFTSVPFASWTWFSVDLDHCWSKTVQDQALGSSHPKLE